MITVLSIRELMLFTGWMFNEDGRHDLGVCDIMGWDPRIIDDFTDEEVERFDSQWVALPDQISKELRILSPPSHYYVNRLTSLLSNGNELHRADFNATRIIHKTSEFFAQDYIMTDYDDD